MPYQILRCEKLTINSDTGHDLNRVAAVVKGY